MSEAIPFPSPLAGEGGARSRSEWEGEGAYPTRSVLLARAKWMRANPTEAERHLWSMLRDRRLAAFKFKRQQIIEPYIVDFICLSRRLIIEADGSRHADNKDDARRDRFLSGQSFQVLRFWNNQVLTEASAVADAIHAALLPPHPPKPAAWAQREGEQRPALFRSCRGHDRTFTLSPARGEGLDSSGHLHG